MLHAQRLSTRVGNCRGFMYRSVRIMPTCTVPVRTTCATHTIRIASFRTGIRRLSTTTRAVTATTIAMTAAAPLAAGVGTNLQRVPERARTALRQRRHSRLCRMASAPGTIDRFRAPRWRLRQGRFWRRSRSPSPLGSGRRAASNSPHHMKPEKSVSKGTQ